MADTDGQSALLESTTPEQVLAAGGVSKRRRNLANKSAADRIRNPHSKSPKRRAGTPEPERRIYTDESEKDISDADGSKAEDSKKQTPVRSRVMVRSKERAETVRRTRSAERPPTKDTTTEIEDDFEIIRRMHKSKEVEDEITEVAKLKADTKPRVKEEPRDYVVKEMPPFIEAPTELRKRTRPKTLPLQKSLSEEEKPKTAPRTKSKTRITKRKVSTSEEEEEYNGLALKGKLTLKPKKEPAVKPEPRAKKAVRKKVEQKKELSEPEDLPQEETEPEPELEPEPEPKSDPVVEKKPWFFQRWFSSSKKEREEEHVETKEPEKEPVEEEPVPEEVEEPVEVEPEKETTPEPEPEPEAKAEVAEEPRRWFISEAFREWRKFAREHADEYDRIMRLKNSCMSSLLLVLIFCGFGGMIFRFTEGAFESFYKCGVKRVKRDFIDSLWSNSQYMLEEDWKSQARRKLMEFENQLHTAHEAGMTSYSGQKSWSFLNAVVYCITVVSTIGK